MENNYAEFLELAWDEHTLNDLSEAIRGRGYEGTPFDAGLAGKVNQQYEIIESGSSVLVYDHEYGEKVFISGNGQPYFTQAVEEELRKRCGGLDYEDWTALVYALEKSN